MTSIVYQITGDGATILSTLSKNMTIEADTVDITDTHIVDSTGQCWMFDVDELLNNNILGERNRWTN